MGADAVGLLYSLCNGDERSLGFSALEKQVKSVQRKVSATTQLAMIVGGLTGLAANVFTFGLLNTMTLSESYCRDKRNLQDKRL